jgi:uncharacterized protein YbaR (Trm112 family)
MDAAIPQLKLSADGLSQLACPACLGTLRIAAAQVICDGCGRAYPVIDGIPVLIVERAEVIGAGKTAAR